MCVNYDGQKTTYYVLKNKCKIIKQIDKSKNVEYEAFHGQRD